MADFTINCGAPFFEGIVFIWELKSLSNLHRFQPCLSLRTEAFRSRISMLFVIGAKWNLRMSICSHHTKSVMRWAPSNEGWLKFNDDGSTLGKFGPTGCGVDFRNSKGHVIAMFQCINEKSKPWKYWHLFASIDEIKMSIHEVLFRKIRIDANGMFHCYFIEQDSPNHLQRLLDDQTTVFCAYLNVSSAIL
ncbi:hypothetical protein Gotur_015452, partial [Gossypium turneri]